MFRREWNLQTDQPESVLNTQRMSSWPTCAPIELFVSQLLNSAASDLANHVCSGVELMFLNLTVILKHHCSIKPGVIGLWVLPSLELGGGEAGALEVASSAGAGLCHTTDIEKLGGGETHRIIN